MIRGRLHQKSGEGGASYSWSAHGKPSQTRGRRRRSGDRVFACRSQLPGRSERSLTFKRLHRIHSGALWRALSCQFALQLWRSILGCVIEAHAFLRALTHRVSRRGAHRATLDCCAGRRSNIQRVQAGSGGGTGSISGAAIAFEAITRVIDQPLQQWHALWPRLWPCLPPSNPLPACLPSRSPCRPLHHDSSNISIRKQTPAWRQQQQCSRRHTRHHHRRRRCKQQRSAFRGSSRACR